MFYRAHCGIPTGGVDLAFRHEKIPQSDESSRTAAMPIALRLAFVGDTLPPLDHFSGTQLPGT